MKYIPHIIITLAMTALYYGIGMGFHYLFKGDTVDWNSSYSLALIFGWPFFLAAVGLILLIAFSLAIILWMWLSEVLEDRRLDKQRHEVERLHTFLKIGAIYTNVEELEILTIRGKEKLSAGNTFELINPTGRKILLSEDSFTFSILNPSPGDEDLSSFTVKKKYIHKLKLIYAKRK